MSITIRQIVMFIICIQFLGCYLYAQQANKQNLVSSPNQGYAARHFGIQNCQNTEPLLLDDTGKEKWLNSKELKKRAVYKASPEPFYRNPKLNVTVVVKVLVNIKGEVECVKVDSGPTLFHYPSSQAIKRWLFKHMVIKGKSVAFLGRMLFVYTYGKVKY